VGRNGKSRSVKKKRLGEKLPEDTFAGGGRLVTKAASKHSTTRVVWVGGGGEMKLEGRK